MAQPPPREWLGGTEYTEGFEHDGIDQGIERGDSINGIHRPYPGDTLQNSFHDSMPGNIDYNDGLDMSSHFGEGEQFRDQVTEDNLEGPSGVEDETPAADSEEGNDVQFRASKFNWGHQHDAIGSVHLYQQSLRSLRVPGGAQADDFAECLLRIDSWRQQLGKALVATYAEPPVGWSEGKKDSYRDGQDNAEYAIHIETSSKTKCKLANDRLQMLVTKVIEVHELGGIPDYVFRRNEETNKGLLPEVGLTCSERLAYILTALDDNKLIGVDFLMGEIDRLVYSPAGYLRLKLSNVGTNGKKNQALKAITAQKKAQKQTQKQAMEQVNTASNGVQSSRKRRRPSTNFNDTPRLPSKRSASGARRAQNAAQSPVGDAQMHQTNSAGGMDQLLSQRQFGTGQAQIQPGFPTAPTMQYPATQQTFGSPPRPDTFGGFLQARQHSQGPRRPDRLTNLGSTFGIPGMAGVQSHQQPQQIPGAHDNNYNIFDMSNSQFTVNHQNPYGPPMSLGQSSYPAAFNMPNQLNNASIHHGNQDTFLRVRRQAQLLSAQQRNRGRYPRPSGLDEEATDFNAFPGATEDEESGEHFN